MTQVSHDPQLADLYAEALSQVQAMAKMAKALINARHLEKAMNICDIIVRSQPSFFWGWFFRGEAKTRLGDFAGAEADFVQALELEDRECAHLALNYLLLVTGRYREAWRHVRAKGLHMSESERLEFGKPMWNGGTLEGKTLLVYGGKYYFGGFGDHLQSVRLFPLLNARCGCRLVYRTLGPLERLFAGLPSVDCLVVEGEPLPHFDATVSLWEMLSIMEVPQSELPPPPQMNAVPPPPVQDNGPKGTEFRIGLTWCGGTYRYAPRIFDGLADIQGPRRIAWYALQKPISPDPPRLPGIRDMSPHMGDFLDTAQLVRQMDLIVTVDTSMAHLAGSLGVPTIVLLLQTMPEWRWGLEETTPWYPTITLLRQPAECDWRSVMRELKIEIGRRMGKKETGAEIDVASTRHAGLQGT